METEPVKSAKLTPSQIRALDSFLSERKTPFRHSTLMEALKRTVSPRTTARLESVADLALKTAAKECRIVRSGHLHWISVDAQTQHTRLQSGRVVPRHDAPVALTIHTRSPGKWAITDLETGEVWMAKGSQWATASKPVMEELQDIVLGE